MYSDKLQQEKVTSKNEISKMVDAFCVKDDIINVPVVRVYEMFNDFCREENFDIKLTQNAFGRILRQHFNLDSKLIRLNGKMVYIYIDKEKRERI